MYAKYLTAILTSHLLRTLLSTAQLPCTGWQELTSQSQGQGNRLIIVHPSQQLEAQNKGAENEDRENIQNNGVDCDHLSIWSI